MLVVLYKKVPLDTSWTQRVKIKNMNLKAINGLIRTFPALLLQTSQNEVHFYVLVDHYLATLSILKQSFLYQTKVLTCISGIDYYETRLRFVICYELLSITYNVRMRVKIYLDEYTEILTCVPIFYTANWWEREVWDLFGIRFKDHPDLRRILLDYGFEGFPMRKDFPVYGYVELFYDHRKHNLKTIPVELAQEFRVFSFDTPW